MCHQADDGVPPDELKARLEAEAKRQGTTEVQIVREAVDKERCRPQPRGGSVLGDSEGMTARNLDEYLEGFGGD